MEKYCPKCHKIYRDMKAKYCTNCATELRIREKRKPIPQELRHKIFVRDGYRCRECGKSNKETSLEIDHIFPLSKGGTTTEDNLWVLCRDCNQAKRDTLWNDDVIKITKNELSNLEKQLHNAEKELKLKTNEDEILDYKFKIKKIKNEYIPQTQNKLNKLIQEEVKLESVRKAKQKENNRKDILFKKLYVELDDELYNELCNNFSLNESSIEDNLRLLVDKYSEKEIYSVVSAIEKELKENEIKNSFKELLFNTLDENEVNLISNNFNLKKSKENVIEYLIYNYDNKNDVDLLINKLLGKKKKKIVLKKNLYENFSDMDIFLFYKYFNLENRNVVISYLVENYSEEEIQSMKKNLLKNNQLILEFEKHKEKIYNKLNNELTDIDILEIANIQELTYSRPLILNFILANFSEEEIDMKEYFNEVDNLFVKKNTAVNKKNISFDGEDLVTEAEYYEKMLDYDSALYCYKRAFKLNHKLWIKNRILNVAKKTKKTKKHTFNTKKPNIYKSKTPKLKKCKNCGVTLSKKIKKCPICHEKL